MPSRRANRRMLLAALVLGAASGGLRAAAAQPPSSPEAPPGQVTARTPELQSRAMKLAEQAGDALSRGEVAKAESLLREQAKLQPGNFVVFYNLACCRAMQGDGRGAGALLEQAVEKGFCDKRQLERDPTLRGVRDDPAYRRLIEGWPAILDARREANLRGVRTIFAKGYEETRDDALRVVYRSAFDARSTEAAKRELALVAAWADAGPLPGLLDPAAGADDAWAIVVLPSREDFEKWAAFTYGVNATNATSMVAGAYDHDLKRLVSMDLGATLRHEFFHLLHWRCVTRSGRPAPVWIMEGLGALVEDYETREGRLVPVPSWRTNIAKRVERLGNLPGIDALGRMPWTRFQSSRPLLNYASARAAFLYLSDSGHLDDWAHAYEETFADDPAGVTAFERVRTMPLADLNKDFREYVRGLAPVPEEIRPGMASLGLEVDAGSGEGPVIAAIPRGEPGKPHPLRLGDVITAIDGKAVRDLAELVRVLSTYQPGDEVTVSYRRGRLVGEGRVMLRAK